MTYPRSQHPSRLRVIWCMLFHESKRRRWLSHKPSTYCRKCGLYTRQRTLRRSS